MNLWWKAKPIQTTLPQVTEQSEQALISMCVLRAWKTAHILDQRGSHCSMLAWVETLHMSTIKDGGAMNAWAVTTLLNPTHIGSQGIKGILLSKVFQNHH